MRTLRSEAMLLLSKWRDESTLLTCEVTFRGVACGVEGTVTELTEDRLRIGDSLLVALDLVIAFGAGEAGTGFDFGLIAFFEDPEIVESPECVALAEKALD